MLLTKVRTDAVMLIAIGVLFVTGVLDAKEMCAGFSAATVVSTGVLGVGMAGLRYTGVLQWMMKHNRAERQCHFRNGTTVLSGPR